MLLSHRDVHRKAISHILKSRYQFFSRGVYTSAMLAGFVGGLLTTWPLILVGYSLVVAYAIRGSIKHEKISIWSRVISGWFQYSYLFVAGFLPSFFIVKGWSIFVIISMLLLLPLPIYFFNKINFFKLFYFNVAREYLREIDTMHSKNL